MPRPAIDEVTVQTVAYLLSQQWPQKEIATLLKVAQASISRCVEKAKGDGWLRISTEFLAENVSQQRLDEIRARVQPADLARALSDLVPRSGGQTRPVQLRVFALERKRGTDRAAEYERFGRVSAAYILELLSRAKMCGVSWGWTLDGIMRGIRLLPPPAPGKRRVEVVPLCGEAWGVAVTRLSSTSLAAQLHERLSGKKNFSRSLVGIPALIPRSFGSSETATLERFLQLAQSYREIFGPAEPRHDAGEPLVDRLDAVITGVGSDDTPLGFWKGELIRTAGLDQAMLMRTVLGDICGTLIPKAGLSEQDTAEVNRINDLWTGVRRHHLLACADRARAKRAVAPGVIVAALGARKAPIVIECVRQGLVNCLAIDLGLADALRRELGLAAGYKSRPRPGAQRASVRGDRDA